MADAYADVIIVGGGVAGLAAADVLSAAGKSVLLLEGRPRLGGRIDTRHDPAWPLPIERGAEFIHGKPKETWEVVQAGGCSLYDVTDEHWVYQRGRLTRPADFYEQVGRVLEQVSAAGFDRRRGATPDVSFDAFLAAHRRGLTPEAKKWARLFVEGFNAADAKQVSCAWLAAAWSWPAGVAASAAGAATAVAAASSRERVQGFSECILLLLVRRRVPPPSCLGPAEPAAFSRLAPVLANIKKSGP